MKRIWTELTIDMSTGEVDMSESSYEMVPDDYEFPVQAKSVGKGLQGGLDQIGESLGFKAPDVNPPTPQQISQGLIDVSNKAAGIEQKIIRDARGNPIRVEITELPKSAEDQAIIDRYNELLSDNLSRVQSLSQSGLAENIPELQPILDDLRERNNILLDRSQGKITRQQETQLAKFGQTDSTAAVEQRVAREAQFAQQRYEADLTVSAEAENLRNAELARSINAINTAQAIRTGQQAALQGGVGQTAGVGQAFSQLGTGAILGSFNANLAQGQLDMKAGQNLSGSLGLGDGGGAAALGSIASMFTTSDRRAKENLVVIGEKAGLPWYSFNYKGEAESQEGFVAQEVRTKYPEAVVEHNGLLHVNYDKVFELAGEPI